MQRGELEGEGVMEIDIYRERDEEKMRDNSAASKSMTGALSTP